MADKKKGKIIENNNPTGGELQPLPRNSGSSRIPFKTRFIRELGIQLNQIVTYVEITDPETGTPLAVSLNPVERGIINSIIDPIQGIGTIRETSGNILEFIQEYFPQLDIKEGDKVDYTIIYIDGKPKATSLVKISAT